MKPVNTGELTRMGRYNVNFQLSVDDMDLIEGALRRSKSELSNQQFTDADDAAAHEALTNPVEGDDQLRRIHDLLGRLHNQKVFYRPRSAPYISG